MITGDDEHLGFEEHCIRLGLDREQHPLHLLYLNKETSKALTHFKAGYAANRIGRPNDRWRKIADELPYLVTPVLLKFPGGAVRIGQLADTNGKFVSYGYKQNWKLAPIEWQKLPE
jgi:hypothetical protein